MAANSNQFSMYHQLFKSPTRLTKRYANDKKQNISHPTSAISLQLEKSKRKKCHRNKRERIFFINLLQNGGSAP